MTLLWIIILLAAAYAAYWLYTNMVSLGRAINPG